MRYLLTLRRCLRILPFTALLLPFLWSPSVPAQVPVSPWIYGIHDTEPVPTDVISRANAAGRDIWITSTVEVGHNPTDQGGADYRQFSNDGHTVLCRINNGYGDSGTIPVVSEYANFAQRCANFVANTQGCDYFIIGNETNLASEWPRSNGYRSYISPQDYANCFRQCYDKIKLVRSSAQVICQALAPFAGPYGGGADYDGNPLGWTTYMNQMLTAINSTGGLDGIAVHINSRGYTYNDVHSTQQVNGQYFSFYVYKDWVNLGTPAALRTLPYYATECNGIYYWNGSHPECMSCSNASCCYQNDWVKWIYDEINAWNASHAASGQGIYRCVNMYRWCFWCDGWNIDQSPQEGNILNDYDEAYTSNYQWPTGVAATPTRTPTRTPTPLAGSLISQGKTVVTDSNFDGTLIGDKIVDGVIAGDSNRWVSNSAADSHHWFYIDLGSQYNLTELQFFSAEANGEDWSYNVKTFTVRGSNTGSGAVNTWTQLASYAGTGNNDYPGTGVDAKITLTLSGTYRYLGVDITCSDGICGTHARVQEAKVFGTAAGSTATPGPTSSPTRTPTLAPTATPLASKGLSLDPGAPIIESTGDIAFAGNLIQDSGAKWVRINFILGPWSSPGDSSLHGSQNLSWYATYDQIINDAVARGLTVYALVGAQAVHSGSALNSDGYVTDYVNNFVAIVNHFKDRVRYYESFNEPNDWAGGSSAQVTPFYFAKMLESIYRAVKIDNGHAADPSWQVTLLSGPLFTHDADTGATYFNDTINAGRNQLTWNSFHSTYGKWPFDGVGYHIYVQQGTANVSQVQAGMNTNINAIWPVITNLDGVNTSLRLWVSEIGWNSAAVSEADQATNVGTALDLLAAESRVAFISWFCLRDFGSPNFWGLERGDASKKPSWYVFTGRAPGFGGNATPTPTVAGPTSTPTRTPTPTKTLTPAPTGTGFCTTYTWETSGASNEVDSIVESSGGWGGSELATFTSGVAISSHNALRATQDFGASYWVWNYTGLAPNSPVTVSWDVNVNCIGNDCWVELFWSGGLHTAAEGKAAMGAYKVKWDTNGAGSGTSSNGWMTVGDASMSSDASGNFTVAVELGHWSSTVATVSQYFDNLSVCTTAAPPTSTVPPSTATPTSTPTRTPTLTPTLTLPPVSTATPTRTNTPVLTATSTPTIPPAAHLLLSPASAQRHHVWPFGSVKGATAAFDVIVENVADLGNFSFELTYDPAIVSITPTSAVSLGAFPSSTGRSVTLVGPGINNNAGLLTTGGNSTGAGAGPSGTGILARVVFTTRHVNQSLTSALDFQNVSLFTTTGTPIGSTATGGSMTVCYYADLDCNNSINIVDVQVVAGRWNTTAGSPNYDANSDLDLDGDIDIQDVQIVAGQWNRSAPFF